MDSVAKPFTLNRSPLTVRYPLTVIHEPQWQMTNGKLMVNACPVPKPERSSLQSDYGASSFGAGGKWTMVNEASERSV